MLMHRIFLLAFLGLGCLLLNDVSARAGEKKDDKDVLFSKTDGLTDKDEKDTKLQKSHRKLYKVKLLEGKVYRIDLSSKDFDTFLRLENPAGKEVAFNDDIDLANKILDSRVFYVVPKTGEYQIIVTSYDPGSTGLFVLEMKYANAAEAKEARFMNRVEHFAESSHADQKKLLAEVTKGFQDKGEDLTIKDAQVAAILFFTADDSDVKALREMGETFSKIFAGASNQNLVGLSRQIDAAMRSLDKIGKELEISGKTLAGKEFDLKKLKGKVVLVDFWGTWCPPCVAEMPNIQEAYKKYHGKGFEVIGVTSDKGDEVVNKFFESRKLPWACINVEDSRALIEKHEVNSFPTPLLVGADGRVISTRARGPQLDRLLERLLKEKK